MAKPSRWNAEKRYQIVKEALSQKEPVGQITRRHQVSEGLIYRWRDKFFEGGKAALAFDGRNGTKDILGIWIEQSEGAKFSLRVITEIKNRGVSDTLIAVADGL